MAKTRKKIPLRLSVYIRFLHKEKNMKICQIAERYPSIPRRTISWHANKPIELEEVYDLRRINKGRPRKLTIRDERQILRAIPRIREKTLSFAAPTVIAESGVKGVSNRTIRRCLNRHKLRYRQRRRKGILTPQDRRNRTKFARKCVKWLNDQHWTKRISFYLDGVGFVYKKNPYEEARSSGNMTWRTAKEGIQVTAKGRKEGTGGTYANFIVAIAYGKGVVLAEQYLGKINGEKFAKIVRDSFPAALENSANPVNKLILQDGDPSQNSKQAKTAFHEVGCKIFAIPARSPDVNPIENIFNLVRQMIRQEALDKEITSETFDEFSDRVYNILDSFPKNLIDSTIESMPKRMKEILKGKGHRTKY